MNENIGQIPHCKSCTCQMEWMRREIEWRDALIAKLKAEIPNGPS